MFGGSSASAWAAVLTTLVCGSAHYAHGVSAVLHDNQNSSKKWLSAYICKTDRAGDRGTQDRHLEVSRIQKTFSRNCGFSSCIYIGMIRTVLSLKSRPSLALVQACRMAHSVVAGSTTAPELLKVVAAAHYGGQKVAVSVDGALNAWC